MTGQRDTEWANSEEATIYKTVSIIDDTRNIKRICGAMENCDVSTNSEDKIKPYQEINGEFWFAVYRGDRITTRINSRYIDSVFYQ